MTVVADKVNSGGNKKGNFASCDNDDVFVWWFSADVLQHPTGASGVGGCKKCGEEESE